MSTFLKKYSFQKIADHCCVQKLMEYFKFIETKIFHE